MSLSIIVPVINSREPWQNLLACLVSASESDEIIFSSSEDFQELFLKNVSKIKIKSKVVFLVGSQGRGRQLNLGVKKATNDNLLFLHSDSILADNSLDCIKKYLRDNPKDIFYFDLKFYDGSLLMKINEIGVALRSRLFHLPFGDQGLSMTKEIFYTIDGFCEDSSVPEDLMFMRLASTKRISIRSLPLSISTSARKYTKNGWLMTTLKHLVITFRYQLLRGNP